MKYKGVLLREREESEAELLVNVVIKKIFNKQIDLEKYVVELGAQMCELLDDLDCSIFIENVTDDLIQIRSRDITFDRDGVQLLEQIYDLIKESSLEGVEVSIGVYLDIMESFYTEDGDAYNFELVSLEEFHKYLEY